MKNEECDLALKKALCRYEVISPFLASRPGRGQKKKLLEALANRSWTDEKGEPLKVESETIRSWVRRYRKNGLEGLKDKVRPRRGVQTLTAEQMELLCNLKREVPERSLDRILIIAESMDLIKPGVLSRSTLHRVLQSEGLSRRQCRIPHAHDLDRVEALQSNERWQSDMLVGPWLPDPERPGKMRRTYLYAFIDDYSRLLLHGRFSFKGDLPSLELVFRRCLQKWGVPNRVYYDNGQVYRSHHMRQIVATLGIDRIVFTQPYRPQGHGKIEALNQYIRSAFIAELGASPRINSLDTLNEAFLAWADCQYNQKVHSETGATPLFRFREGVDRVRYVDEEVLRQAFLWREYRTADKTAIFSLFGCSYQVQATLARCRIEARYDPEALEEIEVWYKNKFVERAKPFSVREHRRPQQAALKERKKEHSPPNPQADWLNHLIEDRRKKGFIEPPIQNHTHHALQQRDAANQAIIELLSKRLNPASVDYETLVDYLHRFGPFDLQKAQATVDHLLASGLPEDIHVTVVLDAIRQDDRKE